MNICFPLVVSIQVSSLYSQHCCLIYFKRSLFLQLHLSKILFGKGKLFDLHSHSKLIFYFFICKDIVIHL